MSHLEQVLDFKVTQECFRVFAFWKFDDDHACGFPIALNWPNPSNYVFPERLAMNAGISAMYFLKPPKSFTGKSSTKYAFIAYPTSQHQT